jgi:class 3 adenylate cyclase
MNDRTSPQDLLDRALAAERQARFERACEILRQVVGTGDPSLALEARLRLGRILTLQGARHRDEAALVLREARGQAEQTRSPHHAARAVHLLALLERYRGNLDQAQQLLDQSPVFTLPGAPNLELGQYFHVRGLVAAGRNDLATAERLYFRAHQFYQEVRYDTGLAEVCDSLANLLLRRGNPRRALAFAQFSLELKRRVGDRRGEAISLGTVGRVYFLQARYPEARDAFLQDLALARELNDEPGVGIMLNSLGEVTLLLGELDTARGYYQENLAADRGPINALHAHLGLARVHLAAGRLDGAETAAGQMATLLGRHDQVPALRDALRGLRGAIAWRRGDLAEGERQLGEAVEGLRQKQADLDTVPFLYELRDLLHRQGRTPEAVKVMARALDLLSECGAERGVRDVEDWLRTADAPALIRLALERHFPDYLVENIVNGQLGRQPSKRQMVTVLFSDIRSYTTLAEGLDPEAVVELLNEWFTEVTRAVRHHGGVVDKFIGDGVMALFGVPEPREDAAADAVRAALAMRDALAALNLRNQALGGRAIRVGIGLHTGEAVVGFIGSHLRQSYTAIGDVVNTASRLESATKDYGCDIIVSQETLQGQEPFGVAETEFLGKTKVKGRQQEVAVYKVLGPREHPAPAD